MYILRHEFPAREFSIHRLLRNAFPIRTRARAFFLFFFSAEKGWLSTECVRIAAERWGGGGGRVVMAARRVPKLKKKKKLHKEEITSADVEMKN